MATETNKQSTNAIENSTPMPNLPHEIIVDILSRLPVKTLMRFRCVSQSWRSLISDPYFIKKHLNISSSDENYTNHSVILRCSDPNFSFKSCSLYSVFNEPSVGTIELDHPNLNPHRSDRLVGSYHGLFCIAVGEDAVYLWNPATRESRRLPKSGFQFRPGCRITYGFGYDLSNRDYKVVAVFTCQKDLQVKVYSLRTNSWRRIGDIPHQPHEQPGLFVNGALNWPAVVFGGHNFRIDEHGQRIPVIHLSWKIVGLDLAAEKYIEIPQPAYGYHGYDRILGHLGGCLCIVANYRGNRADFWIMKEYGVKESWTKLITVPYVNDLYYTEFFPFYKPLWYFQNGELLLEFKDGLVLYNPRDKSFKSPEMRDFQACITSSVYVESLVSPNAEDWI